MSLETWKAEFIPTPACDCPRGQAAAHSLRKWRGLTEENLRKHGLRKVDAWIKDKADNRLCIAASSCALCLRFADTDASREEACKPCPLYKSLGKACDDEAAELEFAPYHKFTMFDDPLPMIAALEKIQ